MGKQDMDYTLYLVTDSTTPILGDRDLCDVVRQALRGGVTVVQYRDKHSETGVLVETGKKLHALTKEFGVPLLINDRVDVALAVRCEGVHIGQDDMGARPSPRASGQADPSADGLPRHLDGPLPARPKRHHRRHGQFARRGPRGLQARRRLPRPRDRLCHGYVSAPPLRTPFPMPSRRIVHAPPCVSARKKDSKSIIGTAGLRRILEAMADAGFASVPAVAIGGIGASNAQQVVFASGHAAANLAGVAVVSAVVAAADPEAAARQLLGRLKALPPMRRDPQRQVGRALDVVALVPAVLRGVHAATPLSHNMTNLVVQNFAANVALAVGASPIMSHYGAEAEDLARLGGALVINMGTVTPDALDNYVTALRAYNQAGQPVVFDPVG